MAIHHTSDEVCGYVAQVANLLKWAAGIVTGEASVVAEGLERLKGILER